MSRFGLEETQTFTAGIVSAFCLSRGYENLTVWRTKPCGDTVALSRVERMCEGEVHFTYQTIGSVRIGDS